MTAQTNGRPPVENAQPHRATRPAIRSSKGSDGTEYATSQAWGDVYEAATYEEGIGAEAATVRLQHSTRYGHDGGEPPMTRELFIALWPLLRRPIHAGHIIATTKAKGKPYESDGVRSVQVLIDRMNNVLTPLYWRITREYEDAGKLCLVTVRVIDIDGQVLAEGQSYGGMDRANTAGNLRKASFTNAAKLAFAAIGPGHEVYTQAIDYDPDLLPGAIEDQNRAPAVASAPAAAPQPKAPDEEATKLSDEEVLARWLAKDDDLTELRADVDKGMAALGASPRQRARELAGATTEQALQDIKTRVSNAFAEEQPQ